MPEEQFVQEHGDDGPAAAVTGADAYEAEAQANAVEPNESEVGVEDTDIEIEVVDDTPTEDQGKTPAAELSKEELEEEASTISGNVKERIDKLTRKMHDQRRAKEAAERELEESTRINQQMFQRDQAVVAQRQQESRWAFEQATRRGELEMQQARSEYESAFEEGDAEAVSAAQVKMNNAQLFQQQLQQASQQTAQQQVAPQQQQVHNQVQPQRQPQPSRDERAEKWAGDNRWFMGSTDEDVEMTNFAKSYHETIVGRGVRPTSDDYYEQIDGRMREVFPERFGVTKKRPPSTVVASSGRVPAAKKVVLTTSQIKLAGRLNITPEQYAEQFVKLGYTN